MATDAFGRLRISDNFTTFNYTPSSLSSINLDNDSWVSAGNSASYNSQNYINMPITTGATNYCIRYTKIPMVYQPGKSRLFYMTGVTMTSLDSTTTSRIGFFNIDTATPPNVTEGTYFQGLNSILYFVDVTQSGTSTVAQSSWNIDTFNGSGPSGQTLTSTNLTQNLLLVFDQEWLGIGRIRCGFIINGIICYAHQFLHSGVSIQYTATPRLRLAYYISGTASNSMRQMCATNISEGGFYTTGKYNSVGVPTNLVVSTDTSTKTIVLALRVNSSYPNGTFVPHALSVIFTGGSNKFALYQLQMISTNGSIGTISGTALSYTLLTNSVVEYAYGNGSANVSSDGYVITSGYVQAQTTVQLQRSEFELLLTRLIFTQYDTLVVVGFGTIAATMGSSIDFIEEN